MTGIVAIVLAGGAARRMGGGDKPLLDLGGRSLMARVLDRIRIPDRAIVANGDTTRDDPTKFASFGLPVLDDGTFLGQGPLAGLLAGLDWAAALGADTLLSVPGDTPFLPRNLIEALSPAPAYASRGDRKHPLVALWPVACRGALRDRLEQENLRDVHGFAVKIGMRRVDFPLGKWDPFDNLNTPADLALARDRLHEREAEGAA